MHVHAGHDALVEGLLQILRSGVKVMYVFYVHPVAHHEALEVPLASQDILHQPFVAVARDAVQFVVRRHQGHGSGFNPSLERREEDFPYRPLGQIRR